MPGPGENAVPLEDTTFENQVKLEEIKHQHRLELKRTKCGENNKDQAKAHTCRFFVYLSIWTLAMFVQPMYNATRRAIANANMKQMLGNYLLKELMDLNWKDILYATIAIETRRDEIHFWLPVCFVVLSSIPFFLRFRPTQRKNIELPLSVLFCGVFAIFVLFWSPDAPKQSDECTGCAPGYACPFAEDLQTESDFVCLRHPSNLKVAEQVAANPRTRHYDDARLFLQFASRVNTHCPVPQASHTLEWALTVFMALQTVLQWWFDYDGFHVMVVSTKDPVSNDVDGFNDIVVPAKDPVSNDSSDESDSTHSVFETPHTSRSKSSYASESSSCMPCTA